MHSETPVVSVIRRSSRLMVRELGKVRISRSFLPKLTR